MSRENDSLSNRALREATKVLRRRPCAPAFLESLLVSKGFPEEVAQGTVQRLVREGWVDQHRDIEAAVLAALEKAYGPRRIRDVLKERGYAAERIEDTLGRLSVERQMEAAASWVAKRYRSPSDAHRAYASLLRRGFEEEVAEAVVLRQFGPAE